MTRLLLFTSPPTIAVIASLAKQSIASSPSTPLRRHCEHEEQSVKQSAELLESQTDDPPPSLNLTLKRWSSLRSAGWRRSNLLSVA
jgi:hypothetical protein